MSITLLITYLKNVKIGKYLRDFRMDVFCTHFVITAFLFRLNIMFELFNCFYGKKYSSNLYFIQKPSVFQIIIFASGINFLRG